MYSYGSPHTAAQKQDDQHERTFSSYVRIQVVVLKTYLGRWTIGRSGERGSGISVLPARYDDDDIYIYNVCVCVCMSVCVCTYILIWIHDLNTRKKVSIRDHQLKERNQCPHFKTNHKITKKEYHFFSYIF